MTIKPKKGVVSVAAGATYSKMVKKGLSIDTSRRGATWVCLRSALLAEELWMCPAHPQKCCWSWMNKDETGHRRNDRTGSIQPGQNFPGALKGPRFPPCTVERLRSILRVEGMWPHLDFTIRSKTKMRVPQIPAHKAPCFSKPARCLLLPSIPEQYHPATYASALHFTIMPVFWSFNPSV